MRIQGVKASVAWNGIRTSNLPAINLEERNAVDIAKVNINKSTVEQIKDKVPEIYENIQKVLAMKEFNGEIDAIAIPLDVILPEWLDVFIDYDSILQDNIAGFPFEASQLVADCTVLTRLVGTDIMLVLSVVMYLMGSESDLGANLVRSFMVHFPEVGHALLKDYLANLE